MQGLLGVQLDDELLLDLKVDVLTLRKLENTRIKLLSVEIQPLRDRMGAGGLYDRLELLVAAEIACNSNDVAGFEQHGRNVGLVPIYGEMTVTYKLSGLLAGGSKAESVNYVVQTALKYLKQVLTGDSLSLFGDLEILSELALENSVVTLRHLLRAKLQTILGGLLASLTVLAGSISSAGHGALIAVAAVALQKQLLSLAAAKSAHRAVIFSH